MIYNFSEFCGVWNELNRASCLFTQQDKWIVFGGMIVTCIIMFFVVKYLT